MFMVWSVIIWEFEGVYKEMQRSNSDYYNQLRTMGNSMEEIQRNFDEIKKRIDSLDELWTLLKELAKQKRPEVVELEKGSFNKLRISGHHEPTPCGYTFDQLWRWVIWNIQGLITQFQWERSDWGAAKAEKFFEIQNTKSELKVPLAMYVWRVLHCICLGI